MQETVKKPSLDKGYRHIGTRPLRPDGADKVTGRTRFGADLKMPGQIHGKVLRSPHAHARLVKIDTSKAEALAGVKAVVTRDDFQDQEAAMALACETAMNYRDMLRTVMAREKVLFCLLYTSDAADD